MSEILTIRLNNELDEPIPWLVWSPNQRQVIASGDADNLMQISSYSKDREVVVLADSSAINLLSVGIPPGTSRQLDNVLPFLLEDELAQDISQVHISLIDKSDDVAQVAVVEHKVIQGWLAGLSLANLIPKRIIPDCLCLPSREEHYCAVFLNERWIVRTDHAKGFAAEEAWLPVMLKSLEDKKGSPLPKIASYSPIPSNSDFNWHAEPAMLVMELLAQGTTENNFNLLSGRYKPSNQFSKYLRYLREIGVAAMLLFAVLAGEQVIQIQRMEKQAEQINAQTMKQVKEVLPGNQRIPTAAYMKRVLETELTRLSGVNSELSLLSLLTEIGSSLQEASNIELSSLYYDKDKGEVRFDAKGKEFADFENLRSVFSQNFKTELGRLNKDNKNVVTGAFVLKKE